MASSFGAVRGFAIGRGSTAGEALAALESLCPLYVSDDGSGTVRVADRAEQTPVVIARRDLGAAMEGEAEPRRRVARTGAAALPQEVSLTYLDTSRDYQAGLQRARRLSAPGGAVERLELPAALDAHTAKQAAERLLARRWRRREPISLALPWTCLALTPGDTLCFEGEPEALFQAREVTVEAGRVVVSAVPVSPVDEVSEAEAEPGAAVPQPDAPHGPTTLHVLDLPPISTTLAAGPVLHLAVAGASEGWRRASVAASLDGGFDYGAAADIPARTIMGTAATALPPGETACWDRVNTVEVALLAPDMALESRSEASVLAGANLCLIGQELMQFATAELLPSGRYRLSGLLRGRRGTEAAASEQMEAGHAAGERFVLLSGAALATYDAGLARVGQTLLFKATSPHEALEDVAAQGVTAAEQAADFGELPASLEVRVAQVSALVGPGAAARRQVAL